VAHGSRRAFAGRLLRQLRCRKNNAKIGAPRGADKDNDGVVSALTIIGGEKKTEKRRKNKTKQTKQKQKQKNAGGKSGASGLGTILNRFQCP